jgi:cobalt-zinc-cadmium resistance protein CzcA
MCTGSCGIYGYSRNLCESDVSGGIAIAIGMLGDASIVIVENIMRNLSDEKNRSRSKSAIIISSCTEVARPIIFSVAIIIIVFIPLFTLEGVEGKMFSPMAFTITFALMGSLIAAIFFSPALSSLLLKKGVQKEFVLVTLLKKIYRLVLQLILRKRPVVLVASLAALVLSISIIPRLGTEFIPVLEEGVIQINVTMAPSISLEKATETIMRIERKIKEFDEVENDNSKNRPTRNREPSSSSQHGSYTDSVKAA